MHIRNKPSSRPKKQKPSACPGVSLIEIFLSQAEPRNLTVLPLRGLGACRWGLYRGLAYAICAAYVVGFFMDVTDLVSGGDFRESPFGKVNPLISLISFASSQIGFFMAATSAVFLVTQKSKILHCADVLNDLVETFQLNTAELKSRISFISQLLLLRGYFYLVLVLGLVRFVMAIAGNQSFLSGFWSTSKYAMITPLPQGLVDLYAHGTMLLSILFYYPVNTLFCYMASIIVGCVKKFGEEKEQLLADITSNGHKLSGEAFVIILHSIRRRHEQINDAFDVLENTFSLKMLLDVLGNIGVVLSGIAWFSVYAADPTVQSTIGFIRHVLAALIYLLTVWVVGNQPIALLQEHGQALEVMEKIIHQRQITTREKPTREETALTSSILDRLKSKELFFVAGGFLELSPFLLGTILAGVTGFGGFVMDKAEQYRSLMEETHAPKFNLTLLTLAVHEQVDKCHAFH